jgi:hypothetical protein
VVGRLWKNLEWTVFGDYRKTVLFRKGKVWFEKIKKFSKIIKVSNKSQIFIQYSSLDLYRKLTISVSYIFINHILLISIFIFIVGIFFFLS